MVHNSSPISATFSLSCHQIKHTHTHTHTHTQVTCGLGSELYEGIAQVSLIYLTISLGKGKPNVL